MARVISTTSSGWRLETFFCRLCRSIRLGLCTEVDGVRSIRTAAAKFRILSAALASRLIHSLIKFSVGQDVGEYCAATM